MSERPIDKAWAREVERFFHDSRKKRKRAEGADRILEAIEKRARRFGPGK